MQLAGGSVEIVAIGGVDHVDDDVDAATVSLPHAAETGLSANVPDFDADVSFLN